MGIGAKLKDILSPTQDGYECTACQISFTGRAECPACGELETVQPVD